MTTLDGKVNRFIKELLNSFDIFDAVFAPDGYLYNRTEIYDHLVTACKLKNPNFKYDTGLCDSIRYHVKMAFQYDIMNFFDELFQGYINNRAQALDILHNGLIHKKTNVPDLISKLTLAKVAFADYDSIQTQLDELIKTVILYAN